MFIPDKLFLTECSHSVSQDQCEKTCKGKHSSLFSYFVPPSLTRKKVLQNGNQVDRIDPRLESTLSVGVDEMSWDDLLEDNYDWSRLTWDQKVKFLESVQVPIS